MTLEPPQPQALGKISQGFAAAGLTQQLPPGATLRQAGEGLVGVANVAFVCFIWGARPSPSLSPPKRVALGF